MIETLFCEFPRIGFIKDVQVRLPYLICVVYIELAIPCLWLI